jgi:hypothetical protein
MINTFQRYGEGDYAILRPAMAGQSRLSYTEDSWASTRLESLWKGAMTV